MEKELETNYQDLFRTYTCGRGTKYTTAYILHNAMDVSIIWLEHVPFSPSRKFWFPCLPFPTCSISYTRSEWNTDNGTVFSSVLPANFHILCPVWSNLLATEWVFLDTIIYVSSLTLKTNNFSVVLSNCWCHDLAWDKRHDQWLQKEDIETQTCDLFTRTLHVTSRSALWLYLESSLSSKTKRLSFLLELFHWLLQSFLSSQ